MSWLTSTSEAYDYVNTFQPKELLPIAHSTQNAQVEITIDENGEFIDAAVVSDEEKVTLIPVTEKSASRSGKLISPHPLCDKLEYLAPELDTYINKSVNSRKKFEAYITQIKEWCESPFSAGKVKAVYRYMKKEQVFSDLVHSQILHLEDDGLLMLKWNGKKEDKPDIFKKTNSPEQSFIRFRVLEQENPNSAVWQDAELIDSYTKYYVSQQDQQDIDFATGKMCAMAYSHSSKIRHTGDKAKLISANDSSGFTYRGRFEEARQVAQIGFESSQKSHNALKYLIQKQGKTVGTKTVLMFGTRNSVVPNLMGDTKENLDEYEEYSEEDDEMDTKAEIAVRFNKLFAGYRAQYLAQTEETLSLLVLASATTGRMSINYYREFKGKDKTELIDTVESWHRHTAWKRSFRGDQGKAIFYVGAPSPKEIAEVAFGTQQGNFIKADEKIVGQIVLRILPCVSEGKKISRDIVHAVVRKANHPQNYSIGNWRYKVLPIACSMMKKYLFDYNYEQYQQIFDEGIINQNNEEEWKMGLKPDYGDLAYNCGRMLCMADYIEQRTYSESEKGNRVTNAMRYYTQFAQHPCRTWQTIDRKLSVYINKLGGNGNPDVRKLRKIEAEINPVEFAKARNLDGKMALGFGAQREFLWTKN